MTIGDRYEASGGIVATGPGATARAQVQLNALSKELAGVRARLRGSAETVADDLEVAEIAEAELAASASDPQGVAKALRRAGKRSLDAAQAIGASVAAQAISHSLGL